jgi:hypothetical protein
MLIVLFTSDALRMLLAPIPFAPMVMVESVKAMFPVELKLPPVPIAIELGSMVSVPSEIATFD